MSTDTTYNAGLAQRCAEAMRELGGDVPPRHAQVLIYVASIHLEENSTRVQGALIDLISYAQLTEAEGMRAMRNLRLINALDYPTDDDDEYDPDAPGGVSLHPELAWRGDPRERDRHINETGSLILL